MYIQIPSQPDIKRKMEIGKKEADWMKQFPINEGYSIGVIVLAVVHALVSTLMLLCSLRGPKSSFVVYSRYAWVVSLVVCLVILVLAIIEVTKLKKVNDDYHYLVKNVM